ncbi:TetR/AcrR family transcriptional regulator, partial [Peribacillus butanolivorans]
MQSGIELFSKQGYSSTSVDQIVKHAGYSKGAFY